MNSKDLYFNMQGKYDERIGIGCPTHFICYAHPESHLESLWYSHHCHCLSSLPHPINSVLNIQHGHQMANKLNLKD
jgi:hypothetical protein